MGAVEQPRAHDVPPSCDHQAGLVRSRSHKHRLVFRSGQARSRRASDAAALAREKAERTYMLFSERPEDMPSTPQRLQEWAERFVRRSACSGVGVKRGGLASASSLWYVGVATSRYSLL